MANVRQKIREIVDGGLKAVRFEKNDFETRKRLVDAVHNEIGAFKHLGERTAEDCITWFSVETLPFDLQHTARLEIRVGYCLKASGDEVFQVNGVIDAEGPAAKIVTGEVTLHPTPIMRERLRPGGAVQREHE